MYKEMIVAMMWFTVSLLATFLDPAGTCNRSQEELMYLLLVLANPWAPSVLPGLEPLLTSSGLPSASV